MLSPRTSTFFGFSRFATDGRWRELEKALEHVLDAEVVHGGAEEDGHLFPGQDGFDVELFADAVEEFDLLGESFVKVGI